MGVDLVNEWILPNGDVESPVYRVDAFYGDFLYILTVRLADNSEIQWYVERISRVDGPFTMVANGVADSYEDAMYAAQDAVVANIEAFEAHKEAKN